MRYLPIIAGCAGGLILAAFFAAPFYYLAKRCPDHRGDLIAIGACLVR